MDLPESWQATLVFDHVAMNTMSLEANGIYLSNSMNMSFSENTISAAGVYGYLL